jgi:hypothetical protein
MKRFSIEPGFGDRHQARYAAVLKRTMTLADALAENERDWHASRTPISGPASSPSPPTPTPDADTGPSPPPTNAPGRHGSS